MNIFEPSLTMEWIELAWILAVYGIIFAFLCFTIAGAIWVLKKF